MQERKRLIPLTGQPAIFGEVLFDHFPDGSRVLGGAPFNVAWHLGGFGLDPLFISRIGIDAEGSEIVERMKAWELDDSGVQVDEKHATGAVRVSFTNGQPSYEILESRAWDFIDRGAIRLLEERDASLLCHGTLALRSDSSRETLFTILSRIRIPALVDINLRDPWWSRQVVERTLQGARWAKMNDKELETITHDRDPILPARELRRRYDLDGLVITRGERGAFSVTDTTVAEDEGVEMSNVVDTVGAGDAFTAVLIAGLIGGWPTDVMLDRAGRFAAEICTRRGATHDDRELYSKTLEEWGQAP